jgi:hypothetical protein
LRNQFLVTYYSRFREIHSSNADLMLVVVGVVFGASHQDVATVTGRKYSRCAMFHNERLCVQATIDGAPCYYRDGRCITTAPLSAAEQLSIDSYIDALTAEISSRFTFVLSTQNMSVVSASRDDVVQTRAQRDTDCALRHSQAGFGEDILLLPTLLRATHLLPGTFVELGALDGIMGSNTYMLEKCFNWTGVLIEGNEENFKRLSQSDRSSVKVHSSVCLSEGTINMTRGGGGTAANVAAMGPTIKQDYSFLHTTATVAVRCRPLANILEDAGFPGGITYFSLE